MLLLIIGCLVSIQIRESLGLKRMTADSRTTMLICG